MFLYNSSHCSLWFCMYMNTMGTISKVWRNVWNNVQVEGNNPTNYNVTVLIILVVGIETGLHFLTKGKQLLLWISTFYLHAQVIHSATSRSTHGSFLRKRTHCTIGMYITFNLIYKMDSTDPVTANSENEAIRVKFLAQSVSVNQ